MTTELVSRAPFRTVGRGDAIPNEFVVPYYLDDLKRRISVARVDGPSLRVRRPLHLRRPGMPAIRRTAHRDDAHVPMPRLPVRHHHRKQ